jgi:hypothetical protein
MKTFFLPKRQDLVIFYLEERNENLQKIHGIRCGLVARIERWLR